MVDPSEALKSFQEEFSKGNLKLERAAMYPNLFVHLETIGSNSFRVTYVLLKNETVNAFVNIVPCDPIEKNRCFQIGYAVPEKLRNRGLAKKIINMVLEEMRNGYKRVGIPIFYIEAIVPADNKPSQRVAESTISSCPKDITDQFSGLPALQYIRKID